MLKKLLLFFTLSIGIVRAYDPTSVPNNRVGIHILDPNEINEAAKLVNSAGGDWGYVTIPIRSNDRDRDKWLKFFQNSRRLHLIPIIRLATFPVERMWVEPNAQDLVDFANFLNDMPWPTQNRYIILFNEPNHAQEWGQTVNPYAYANLLVSAKTIFKERSADFFLLSAGLDMSSPNSTTSMNALQFYRQMTFWQPLWTSSIDGLAVHVYPNSRAGITSYKYEPIGNQPVFITETGWVGQPDLYPWAFSQVWTEKNIVAITPFLLFAGAGEFTQFSLTDSPAYFSLMTLLKTTGSPLLTNVVINNITIDVEIADTEAKRIQGLSNRTNLADQSGMLFIFSDADRHSFWMKDMNFPLDFIWIRSGRVVQISTNIPVTQPPVTLSPSQPVDQVLEVNAGFIDKYGIKVGNEVRRR